MNAPLIGITERRFRGHDLVGMPGALQTLSFSGQLTNYAEAIALAGGIPVHVPREIVARPFGLLERLDALVIAGGDDVDPRLYGGIPTQHSTVLDPERDRVEVALVLAALESDTPIVGVCRGAQLLNVALGGTLVSHLPVGTGDSHGFLGYPPHLPQHVVRFVPGSRCAELYGTAAEVNSLHHQAVDLPGEGVEIVGRADDGTVEAIEVRGRRALGVQWHPELLGPTDPLFEWLVALAAAPAKEIART